jgi:uncharacterized protein (UPF0335 family)
MAVEDSVAQDQLRAFVERIERMEDEKSAIASDIKEIYAEAKGNGFDTKILRKIVTIRKQDANERMEQEALLDLYMGALGMGGDVSSDYSENRRNSIADEIDEDLLTTVAETAKTPEGRRALMDAVAAHKNGSKLSQLRADPALAIVEAAKITPKTQPSQPAGSDLTSVAPDRGQVAPNSDVGQSMSAETPVVVGDSAAARRGPQVSLSEVHSAEDTDEPHDGAAQTASAAPLYAAPGVVTWESTPPEGVERHPFSNAFGTLGQDAVVIADDIAKASAQPIVKIGNVILDGWARYMTARGAVGLDGQSTEYPVMQYAGTDPLLDCIRWNIAGRILSDKDKQTVVARLIAIEPKRKAEILKAVAELAP